MCKTDRSTSNMAAPDLPITLFADDSASSLQKLRDGKALVVDFCARTKLTLSARAAGTTRCERCPACLTKLDGLVEAFGGDVAFASVCLDDPEFAKEIVEENEWERMTHAGMDVETKELAKAHWGFKAVPYLVVIDATGETAFAGSALKVTAETIETALAGKENATAAAPPANAPAAPAAPAFAALSLDDDDF